MGRGFHELLKVSPGPPFLRLVGGPPTGRPAAVFYPLGYPTPCGRAGRQRLTVENEETVKDTEVVVIFRREVAPL